MIGDFARHLGRADQSLGADAGQRFLIDLKAGMSGDVDLRPSEKRAMTRSCCWPFMRMRRSFGSTRTLSTWGALGSPSGVPAAIQPRSSAYSGESAWMRRPPP